MVRGVPLTEREVREALGLSHRAASLALADAEAWGIVERVSEPRRVGRRGPAGTAYVAVGDHWQWFTSVIAERKVREGDPIVDVIEKTTAQAGRGGEGPPGRPRAAPPPRLADRVRRRSSGCSTGRSGSIPKLEPRELERGMRLLGEVSDETVLRLVHLLGGLPDDDVLELVEALSRLSPERRPPGDEADVGGRPDRRPLALIGVADQHRGRETPRSDPIALPPRERLLPPID